MLYSDPSRSLDEAPPSVIVGGAARETSRPAVAYEASLPRLECLARKAPAIALISWLLATAPLHAAPPDVPLPKQAEDNPTMQFPMSQSIRDPGLSVPGDLNENQQFREVFKLVLRRNEAVVLDLQSNVFDAKLQVLSAEGEELAKDDDSGDDGRSSRLIFAPPADKSGVFYVVASSADNRGGKFSLTATPRRAPQQTPVTEIRAGEEVKGRFGTTSPLILDQQKIYARYWFEAAAGDRIVIEARSTDLSLDLSLSKGDQPISGGATSSKGASLYYPAATAGRHQIEVVTKSDSAGDYTLLLKRLPKQGPLPPPQPLLLDQPVAGAFTEDSPTASPTSNRPRALFLLEGAAGDKIAVSAKVDNVDGSAGYDALPVTLSAGADTPAGFAEVQRAASQSDTAQIVVTFTDSGPLLVQLVGRSGAISPYSLVARRAAPTANANSSK